MALNIDTLINNSPNYVRFHNNSEANYIYTNILCNPSNLNAMCNACVAGVPALAVVVSEIEHYFDGLNRPTFDVRNDCYARSYIGRMISIILKQYGFSKTTTTKVPKSTNSKYFSKASKYSSL